MACPYFLANKSATEKLITNDTMAMRKALGRDASMYSGLGNETGGSLRGEKYSMYRFITCTKSYVHVHYIQYIYMYR